MLLSIWLSWCADVLFVNVVAFETHASIRANSRVAERARQGIVA